jgi:hypothetical protein
VGESGVAEGSSYKTAFYHYHIQVYAAFHSLLLHGEKITKINALRWLLSRCFEKGDFSSLLLSHNRILAISSRHIVTHSTQSSDERRRQIEDAPPLATCLLRTLQ